MTADVKTEVQAGLTEPDEGLEVAPDDVEEVEIVEEKEEKEDTGEEASESELQARDAGWRPKDEWDGAAEDWVSADEFNRRGELLRKIHNQNRQIKQLDGVVTTLAKQQTKIFDTGYDKAKRELRSRLREATKEGDDATADVIEERLEQLETQKAADTRELTPVPQQAQVVPEFAGWVARNDWFVKHPEMRAYAEVIGMRHAQENINLSNTDVYDYVTKQVRTKFPERFGMTTKKVAAKVGSPVESSGDVNSGHRRDDGSGVTRVVLNAEEKAVGRALISTGIYKNMNEYAADLKKYGAKS